MKREHRFGISESNRYYRVYNGSIEEVLPGQLTTFEKKLTKSFISDLFHHSYDKILFCDTGSNSVLGERAANFSSFYPSTHLDFIPGITQYTNDILPFPVKLFINPTNKCNYRCQVCSFNPTRNIKGFHSIPFAVIHDVINLLKKCSPNASLNITGGGEPTLYSELESILEMAKDSGLKVFLTTNGSKPDKKFWERVVKACSMLVFSIRGLTSENYLAIENPINKNTSMENIRDTLDNIMELRERLNRREELIVGINSLVHPLNTGKFYNFTRQMDDLGIDFLYFTPIAPNLVKWGIHVTESQKEQTQKEFEDIAAMDIKSPIKIRLPKVPYKDNPDDTYYLKLSTKNKSESVVGSKDNCYVSLFSPALIPSDLDPDVAKLSPCRASEVQDDKHRAFSTNLGNEPFRNVWTKRNLSRVQKKIKERCSYCYLERQFLDLKFMVDCRRKYSPGEFLLSFDLGRKKNVHFF